MIRQLLHSHDQDQPTLAVVVMLIGLLALSLQDAIGKLLTDHLSLWQFQTTRAVLNIAFVLILARFTMKGVTLVPVRVRMVVLRSGLHVCALMCFFGSAPFLTMAEMAGGLYTFPLFVALLSALFLNEQVGIRRVCAIIIGFVGTLLILRPGSSSFQFLNLLPIAAGFFYANFIIVTRRYCRRESPLVLTLVSNLTICLVGCAGMVTIWAIGPEPQLVERYPFVLGIWETLTAGIGLLILICTLFNVVGNVLMSKAYQSAESSFLAPFDYSYLIFATFWGFIFWQDIPSPITLVGMVLIAGSGIFVALRMRQLAT